MADLSPRPGAPASSTDDAARLAELHAQCRADYEQAAANRASAAGATHDQLALATAHAADLPEPVRDLLAAVLEALDIPHPATLGGTEAHDRLLNSRVVHARIALRDVLDDGPDLGPAWTARYLRERLAENPVTGYVTVAQAHAALDEGKTWSEAVTLPAGEDQ